MRLTQKQFADVMGVRQQTVSEWESGVYVPTRSTSKHLTRVAEEAGFIGAAEE
jgi:DNA-binding transcriptional regulator YiaG